MSGRSKAVERALVHEARRCRRRLGRDRAATRKRPEVMRAARRAA
jgi:hypothetical protein